MLAKVQQAAVAVIAYYGQTSLLTVYLLNKRGTLEVYFNIN